MTVRTRLREPTADAGGIGLRGILGVWLLWVVVAAATWATNARTPVRSLYAVKAAGVRAGAGRALVLLGWPVALVAIAVVVFVLDRLLATEPRSRLRRAYTAAAVAAVGLSATIFLPGVIDAKHVDAKPMNVPAAAGVAIAFALSAWAVLRTGWGRPPASTRLDRGVLLLFAALLLAALPWALANLGVYAGDVPGLRGIFMSKQVVPESGYPHLAAVHLGNHDGFDGLLLALSAVVLARGLPQLRRLSAATAAYLALIGAYGLEVAVADWWLEQVVKRGWSTLRVPSVATPSLSGAWAGVLVAALLVWLLELRLLRMPTRRRKKKRAMGIEPT